MGTHPLAPSTLDDGITAAIRRRRPAVPVEVHGCGTTAVAADASRSGIRPRPASNWRTSCGVPRDSPNRIYRDPSAKPEMLCAVTTFDTLCGFRPVDDTLSLLPSIDAHDLADVPAAREVGDDRRRVVSRRVRSSTSTIDACRRHDRRRSEARHRARRDVSRRPVGRRHSVAEPGDARGRRGHLPRARQPARLPPRVRRRGDGQQRQRRARRHDA